MKILTVSDEESPALWDYYVPGRLADYDLILSCGDLKPEYLSLLNTRQPAGSEPRRFGFSCVAEITNLETKRDSNSWLLGL